MFRQHNDLLIKDSDVNFMACDKVQSIEPFASHGLKVTYGHPIHVQVEGADDVTWTDRQGMLAPTVITQLAEMASIEQAEVLQS